MAAQIPHALARATTRGVRWLGACEAQEMTSEIRHAHPITQTTRAEALQLRLSATLETQPRNPKESAPRRANKIPEPMEPTFYSGPQIALTPETHLDKTTSRLQARRSQTRTKPTRWASGEIPESVSASLVEPLPLFEQTLRQFEVRVKHLLCVFYSMFAPADA